MTTRGLTKVVNVGGVVIGGDDNVTIQSMTNTATSDVEGTLSQIERLRLAGCDIVRLAVPDAAAAKGFADIKKRVKIPLVADIHFDYKLALDCIEGGADKIRINPGNIGGVKNVEQVANLAERHNVPMRIGVNSGSMPKDILAQLGNTAQAMVESALRHIELLNRCDFDNIVVSLKSSDVRKTIEAYTLMSKRCDYPLHIGVTEAGTFVAGTVKSAIGIGALLLGGIGNTIRVSLTDDPVQEVVVAKEILKTLGIRTAGVELISCPSCGRCKIDIISVAAAVERAVANIDKRLKVAVMGCVVNGPGEASEADIGIAGGDGCAMLFKKGKVIRRIEEEDIVKVLIREIEEF